MDDLGLSFDELRHTFGQRGALPSAALQNALHLSQPSVSRLLASAAARVTVLGQGRATRYAWPQTIGTAAAEQPLTWIDEAGVAHPFARLAFSPGGWVHVQAGRTLLHTQGALPWFMAPLRGEGFLGRVLARHLAPQGVPADPGAWSIEHQLLAALHTPDGPGALRLGDAPVPAAEAMPTLEGLSAGQVEALLDSGADSAGRWLPTGSSAGGEQAKFLLRDSDGHPLVAKFSPPRGTPFGERWNDLLCAEATALALLAEHGVPTAATRIVQTARRTLLLSRRFDRSGRHGRRHVVPLWAVHAAFVAGERHHWAATCQALELRKRVPPGTAAQARALLDFGRLIGNTDMHFGNLSLFVAREQLERGRFTLAPLYDMLPMRWRPDPATGEVTLWAKTPAPDELATAARPLAAAFWGRVADDPRIGRDFRRLAAEQHRLIAP
jgi:hypothetical protein